MAGEPHGTAIGPTIRFEDVHTRWSATGSSEHQGSADRAEALAGLSLTLPPGRITVLLGDHQSGKSLLALHLLGLVAPDSGRVLVADTSVWELSPDQRAELKRRFGVMRGGPVMREMATDGQVSVLENIMRGRAGPADDEAAAAHRFLAEFDLDQFAGSRPGDLKSGARRRLALATALVGDPSVVVIDDPGEGMDSEHLTQVVEAIRRWHARTRATVLLCVRSLRVARDLGDQVAVLRFGRVESHGPPEQVLDGVLDDDSFEERFGTGLGGYAEADPERSERGRRKGNKASSRRQSAMVLVFLVVVLIILYLMLFSGLQDRNSLHSLGRPATAGSSVTA